MNLDYSNFLETYLPNKFPDYKISGTNFMTRCVFCEGKKRKLGIDLRTGIFHCFYCLKNGDLITLYSHLENLSYQKANSELLYKVFSNDRPKPKDFEYLVQYYTVQEEFDKFVPINLESYQSSDQLVVEGWKYLYKRKLFDFENLDNNIFYVAHEGKFHDRLILPYIYRGTLLYFQGRSLQPNLKPKYLNPGSDHGVRSSDLLFPFELEKEYVVVCEGSVDARSLQLQGVNATCTVGCYISDVQMQSLKDWGKKLIIGYDNDEAGQRGIRQIESLRKKKVMPPIYICHPPAQFKDWNEAHMENFNLKSYIENNTFQHNFENYLVNKLNSI